MTSDVSALMRRAAPSAGKEKFGRVVLGEVLAHVVVGSHAGPYIL
jgi:hypothetical protein